MNRKVGSRLLGGFTAASVLLVANCAINPVSGRREFTLISEAQEIAMGKQGAADVTAAIGLYPDERIQGYVSAIGQAISKRTERANLAWEYHVIDDASVNAFALPGGFVFVTRGLLTQMTSEAELASVLGHESGHIAARHSVQQMSRQQLATLGLGLGSALSPFLAKYGEVAAAGVGLLMLKNSREDETHADKLGFWYAVAEGYDTREMIALFEMLQRDAALGGRGRLPEWQASHPDPEHRIRDIQRLIEASSHDFGALKVDRDAFIQRLDGMTFGEDPRAGYFRGALFLHPDLAFTLRFPEGWRTQNGADAVTAISPAEDAIVQLRAAAGSASQAAHKFLTQEGVREGRRTTGTVHGNTAVSADFTATEGEQSLQGTATFIEQDGRTWAIIAYTELARFETYSAAFRLSLGSFQRLTDPVALAVQPLRIDVVAAPRAMTLKEFNGLKPSAIGLEEVAMINGMATGTVLRAGQPVKRVVGTPLPR